MGLALLSSVWFVLQESDRSTVCLIAILGFEEKFSDLRLT